MRAKLFSIIMFTLEKIKSQYVLDRKFQVSVHPKELLSNVICLPKKGVPVERCIYCSHKMNFHDRIIILCRHTIAVNRLRLKESMM